MKGIDSFIYSSSSVLPRLTLSVTPASSSLRSDSDSEGSSWSGPLKWDSRQPSVLVLAAAAAAFALPLPGAGPPGGCAPGLGSSLAADSVRQLGVRGEGLGAGPLGVGALRGVEVGVAAGVARPVRARGGGAAAGLGAVSEACAEILL